jgi:FtsZ-binding cell division protein ZapB
MGSPDNNNNPNNWVFDFGLIDDDDIGGGDLPSLDHPPGRINLCVEFDDSFGNSDCLKEAGSRKRVKTGSCSLTASKACREKMRRDKLNDRFLELGSILDPGRPLKMDKALILGDTVRMVTKLREEAQMLKESKDSLQDKINELKAEKNEIRDEKQRLKSEKENLEWKVKAMSCQQPSFLSHPPAAMPAPFPIAGQGFGGKMVPFMGYPGVSMWQFMPPAVVDTSQDHVLRPPVA